MLTRTPLGRCFMLPTKALHDSSRHALTARFPSSHVLACSSSLRTSSSTLGRSEWRAPRSSTTENSVLAPVAALCVSRRHVQFEQTSETIRGINKSRFSGKKGGKTAADSQERAKAEKWITKSTKDYMAEAESKQKEEAKQEQDPSTGAPRTSKGAASLVSQQREELREQSTRRRERAKQISEETDRQFELEMDRLREDDSSRFRKMKNFFKRQGKAFFILYTAAYVGTFVILYVGFASGIIKKESAFEFMFFFLGSYINKDAFYRRIEAWDTYVNFGFAFLINEMLEIVRFPVVMFLFYQLRPIMAGMNRRVKPSIFKSNAAES